MSETKPGALNRLWSSKASAIAAVVVIALVVLSIGALIVWNTIDGNKDAQAGAEGSIAATAPANAAATSTAKTGGCDVPAGDQSLQPTLPKDLDWKASNGVTWPVSAIAGPTQNNAEGFGVCFAKSPLGAALMTANFLGAIEGVDALGGTELYVAESPGKTDSLAQSKAGPTEKGGLGASTGFMVTDFNAAEGTASTALVYANAKSTTGYVSAEIQVRWIDGDWKVWMTSGGANDWTYSQPVSGQFIPWKGTP